MPKYENALIYKLIHKDDYENANIYIGSTTNFKMRKYEHSSVCNNTNSQRYNLKVYKFIRENGGWDQWDMIQLEAFPCNNEQELKCRERHYIELMKSNLNKIIPLRTHKERYENNREDILEKSKKRYEENREVIAEKAKEYREDKKDIISQRRKTKVICECCGCNTIKDSLKRHQRSAKCLKAQAEKII